MENQGGGETKRTAGNQQYGSCLDTDAKVSSITPRFCKSDTNDDECLGQLHRVEWISAGSLNHAANACLVPSYPRS